eukprot:1512543-Rhodomonas_salina.2
MHLPEAFPSNLNQKCGCLHLISVTCSQKAAAERLAAHAHPRLYFAQKFCAAKASVHPELEIQSNSPVHPELEIQSNSPVCQACGFSYLSSQCARTVSYTHLTLPTICSV